MDPLASDIDALIDDLLDLALARESRRSVNVARKGDGKGDDDEVALRYEILTDGLKSQICVA
jgi:hypothetical protein